MTNLEIVRLFRDVAAAYSIKDEKKYRFQIIAYQRAADIIENSVSELSDLYKDKKLNDFPGIGTSMRSHLEELFKSGKVKYFEQIFENIPKAVFPLLDIPGFGPKKAYKLVSEFKLDNPENVLTELAMIAESGKIAHIAGFGEKSQTDILRGIDEYRRGKTKTSRMLLSYASELAENILVYLKASKDVIQAQALGSLRRRMSTIGDVDIAVTTDNPAKVLDYFVDYPAKDRVIERGDRTSSILVSSGRQVDLMAASPESFGALLQHFTGSKAHNIHLREYALSRGLSLSDYGIKRRAGNDDWGKVESYATEESFYKALGMDWIPPEIREDRGEIELALKHNLPSLIEAADIKGDFHLHSSYPIEPSHDLGQNTMEEMIETAIELKYSYMAFTEHNPSISRHKTNDIFAILEKRNNLIERLKLKYNKFIRIYSLLEVDILSNGELAIDDESLSLLDGAVVSIHSVFDMDKTNMTKRVLKGLAHPKSKILAHPTGRLLNQRLGYELDWEVVFDFCKKNNKAMEINASPFRLDLPDVLVRKAIDFGVDLVIDTDSHSVPQMSLMKYGVFTARRGWASKHDILNTKSYNEIERWFNK